MRKKLVLTRSDIRAPRNEQVIGTDSSIELSQRAKELAEAQKKEPEKHELYIELSNELSKQMLYREAAQVLSTYLIYHPFNAEALCLRGRKYLAIQRFEESACDLELSARLDSNSWATMYHLGIVQFIRGDFSRSACVFRRCFELSEDGGSKISAANWYWTALTREGRMDEASTLAASIDDDIDYGENYSYYKCVMLYKGLMTMEEVLKVDEDDIPDITLAVNSYGAANFLLANGDLDSSYTLMRQTVKAAEGDKWSAFAYLAASADLRRAGLTEEVK